MQTLQLLFQHWMSFKSVTITKVTHWYNTLWLECLCSQCPTIWPFPLGSLYTHSFHFHCSVWLVFFFQVPMPCCINVYKRMVVVNFIESFIVICPEHRLLAVPTVSVLIEITDWWCETKVPLCTVVLWIAENIVPLKWGFNIVKCCSCMRGNNCSCTVSNPAVCYSIYLAWKLHHSGGLPNFFAVLVWQWDFYYLTSWFHSFSLCLKSVIISFCHYVCCISPPL